MAKCQGVLSGVIRRNTVVRSSRIQASTHTTRAGIAIRNGGYYHTELMRTISLKLPDDLLAELEREARARRVTKSVLVRQSLEVALRRRPGRRVSSCFDLARDLAGSLKGLHRDLAHNPKYMEGFGE